MHECRARTCTAHCSAVAVELEGRPPGTQWRYCYQCHKYHELKEFSSPDGSALGLHNCYGSQQRRLKRRKLKEQQKQWDVAAKRFKEEMEKRTGGADAGQLFAMHQFAFAEAAASAALGPWAVGGATIAARRLGIKAAMNKAMWAVTPLATPSPPSSGEPSPKHGAAATQNATPGEPDLVVSPSLLPPLDDKLMSTLEEYLAHPP